MATTSLFDLAILDRADQYTGLIEDVTTLPKEFETIPVHKRAGFYYYTAKRTGLPPVQFRNVNAGVASSKSNYKQEIKQMMPIDGRVEMDEMVFDADPGTVGNLFQLEVAGLIVLANPYGFLAVVRARPMASEAMRGCKWTVRLARVASRA